MSVSVGLPGGQPTTSVPAGQKVGVDYTSQVYGRMVQLSQGQRGIIGVPIWCSPIYLQTTKITIDPAHPEFDKTYTSFLRDFAIAFGYNLAPDDEHGEAALLRLWADKDTVFDARFPGVRTQTVLLAVDALHGGGITAENDFTFNFYPGDEDQNVDPSIFADKTDIAGANKGMLYVVIKGWMVGAVLNTPIGVQGGPGQAVFGALPSHDLPVMMAEIVDGLVLSNGVFDFTMIMSDLIRADGTMADWGSNRLYGWSDISGDTPKLYVFNASDKVEIESFTVSTPAEFPLTLTDMTGVSNFTIFNQNEGYILTTMNGGNTAPLVTINPNNGTIIDYFGHESTNTTPSDVDGNPSLSSGEDIYSVPSTRAGDIGYLNDGLPVFIHGAFSEWVTPIPVSDSGTFHMAMNKADTIATAETPGSFIGSVKFDDGGDLQFIKHLPLWEISGKTTQDGCCIVGVGTRLWAFFYGYRDNGGERIAILGRQLIRNFGGSVSVNHCILDPNDGTFVVLVADGSDWTALRYDVEYGEAPSGGGLPRYQAEWQGLYPNINTGATYEVSIPPANTGVDWTGLMNHSQFSGGTLGYPSGLDIVEFDFRKGTYKTTAYSLPGDGMIWNSHNHKLFFTHGTGTSRVMAEVDINASSGEVKTLADYLRWICLRAGYEDGDIDIDSELDDEITGFLLDHAMAVTDLLANIGTLYDFKFYESDGKIKFTRQARGDSAPDPSFELTLDDLAKVEEDTITDNDNLITLFDEPADQLRSITVQYLDSEQNYSYQTQTYAIDQEKSGTVGTADLALFTPFVTNATEAYDRITKLSIRSAASSITQEWRLPQKYLRLEPTDVVSIEKPPFAYRIQINEVTFNADWSISLAGTNYDFSDDVPTPDNENLGLHDDGHGLGPQPNALHKEGFDMHAALAAFFPISVSAMTLGFDMDAEIDTFLSATTTHLFGFSEAAVVTLEQNFSVSMDEGFSQANSISLSLSIPAISEDYGFDQAVTVDTVAAFAFSYSNTFGTGNRTASITVTTTATTAGGGGSVSNLVNGNASVGSTNSWSWTNGQSSKELKFDFGSGNHPVIKQARWKQDSTSTHGTWKWRGSDDDSTYFDIGVAFTLGGVNGTQIHTELISNVTGYRYYKLVQQTGTTSSSPWLEEIEFFVHQTAGTSDNGDTSYYYALGGQTETNQENPNVTGNTGNARAITVTVSSGPFAGTINNLVDGAIGNNSTDSVEWTNALTNMVLKFDFVTAQRCNEFFYVQSTSAAQGTYTMAGSNDDSSYTTLATGIDLSNSSSNHKVSFTNADAYRYYRLTQTGGTTSGGGVPWVQEFYFKVCPRDW